MHLKKHGGTSSGIHGCIYSSSKPGQFLFPMCVLDIIPNLTRGARPFGLIENVVTHAGYRNQGYGTALMGHVLNFARQKGCYKVMLLAGRTDPAVFRMHEKAGFIRGAKEGLIAYPPYPGT